ncbi:13355_t:CDS:2, partial [Acaulospora colombiana]
RLNSVFKLPRACETENIGLEARQLAAGLKWDPIVLAEHLQIGLQPGPASIDLVGAVLRQSTFVAKMYEMGWSKPGQIPRDQETATLVRAVARYHAFLDLLSQSAYSFFVPTLDLAWHTHQLTGPTYREDTLKLLDRTPNHDDAVEQTTLQGGYDETAKAWKARFGTPYSVCGCMVDATPEKEKPTEKGKATMKN